MFPRPISADRQRGSTDPASSSAMTGPGGRVQSSSKNKGAKPDYPAMQPFKSLGSHGVVAQDFVNAFEKFLRPLPRVSNFDLSVPHVLCVDHQSQSLEAV